jgi:hypothetical protein
VKDILNSLDNLYCTLSAPSSITILEVFFEIMHMDECECKGSAISFLCFKY